MTERQPFEALRDELHPSDRIVITGASGWLGQSLLHALNQADHTMLPDRVLALGSRNREISLLDGPSVRIREWKDTEVAEFEPTIAVHLAYLTADRLRNINEELYSATNHELSARGLALQQLPGLRAFMLASSGAATVAGAASTLGKHPYARQKADDERAYLTSHAAASTPTLAARLWSVSGPYCTRPQSYAFSDMVMKARAGEEIIVAATGEVRRRYVDAGEFLAACLALNLRGRSGIVNSGGDEVEIRELATVITQVLGGIFTAPIIDPQIPVELYLAESADMESAARELGIRFTDLADQILLTSRGLR